MTKKTGASGSTNVHREQAEFTNCSYVFLMETGKESTAVRQMQKQWETRIMCFSYP